MCWTVLERSSFSLEAFLNNTGRTSPRTLTVTATSDWRKQSLRQWPLGRAGPRSCFPRSHWGRAARMKLVASTVFPGTYAIRSSTLRSVFMDLASELGEQGFRWIFVVHGHGAPNHNRMLDQAGDYFHDTYRRMDGAFARPFAGCNGR